MLNQDELFHLRSQLKSTIENVDRAVMMSNRRESVLALQGVDSIKAGLGGGGQPRHHMSVIQEDKQKY